MSGLNPDWAGNFLSVQLEFDDVLAGDLQALGHFGAEEDGVVPGELRHWLGKFLEPAVVGELSVVDGGIAAEVELDGGGVGVADVQLRELPLLESNLLRSECGAFDPTVMQRLAPELIEVRACMLLLPVGTDKIVSIR